MTDRHGIDGHVCTHACQKMGQPKEYVVQPASIRKTPKIPKQRISIGTFLPLLNEIMESKHTSDSVADFLKSHPLNLDSLAPYMLFSPKRYTRNLVFANPTYEVMLLYWDKAQATPVHNHGGQSCWVYLLSGQLSFTNYKWLGCDREKRSSVHLETISRVPMAAEGSMNVIDERDAVHRLGNDAAFDARALSLHIYSKPLASCVVYNEQDGTCQDRQLAYDSVEGKVV